MPDAVWHKPVDDIQAPELLAALSRNCECVVAPVTNIRTTCCPGHASLKDSQSFVDHLEFARTLADQLRQGEWSTRPTHRPGGKP